MRIKLAGIAIAIGMTAVTAVAVAADTSPNGPGQPGAPNTTCQQFTMTPGSSANSNGAPFNPTGQSGNVYAGNPGTASSLHAESSHAVSQYDVACFQQTSH
ncbi:MAG TPA: hypothetical protein VGH93_03315 [Solirubrobacteraceae bacterium]